MVLSLRRNDMFQVSRGSPKSLTDQIVEHFTREVDEGRLAEGARLPSVRQLASRLQVSSHTTMTAYERLVSLGRLSSRPGSGYFVAAVPRHLQPADLVLVPPSPDTPGGLAHHILESEGFLQASSGYLPSSWLGEAIPATPMARAIRNATEKSAVAPAQGSSRLRSLLAARLRRRGVNASPANILTTVGASHALQLAARALAAPGEVVLVDDPGYFFLRSQLADLGIRVVGVPRTPDGPDHECLERLAEEYRPKAYFTQSTLQNPTGWSMSLGSCHKVLVAAGRWDFVVVEDDVHGELGADGSTRLAQFEGLRRVMYVAGTSKVLTPAIRVGFVAASKDLVEALTSLKMSNVLSGSLLEEELLAELLESGRFARHVLHLRDRIARVRPQALNALEGAGLRCEYGTGACPFAWCELPRHYKAVDLADQARAEGILLAPGPMFSPSGNYENYVRLSVPYAADPRLLKFLRRNLLLREE